MDPLYTNPDTLALKATVPPESAGKFKGIAIMAALLELICYSQKMHISNKLWKKYNS